jgi:hypothetical protein
MSRQLPRDVSLSRRALLRGAGYSGLLLALPGFGPALAQSALLGKPASRLPEFPIRPNSTGDGFISPYGEVRTRQVDGELLPLVVNAVGGVAVMELGGREPFVRIGQDLSSTQNTSEQINPSGLLQGRDLKVQTNTAARLRELRRAGGGAITLTPTGITFGQEKKVPWDQQTVRRLIDELSKDRGKANAAMLLRSALNTAYPVAVAAAAGKGQSQPGARTAKAIQSGSASYGQGGARCTTTTVTETTVRTVTEVVEVVKTAWQQYVECYDREVARGGCANAGFLAGACATTYCGAKGFIDIVVGFVEVVVRVVEEVVRQVVVCTKPHFERWPNPWRLSDQPIRAATAQPKQAFALKDLEAAAKLLKGISNHFGPMAKCLLDGKWSLNQLDTGLNLGGQQLTVPYGVKVCISAECARGISIDKVGGEALSTLGTSLGLLTALSSSFASATGGIFALGQGAAIAAAIAAAGPLVAAAAALLLAFIILALIYGTAIAGQLFWHQHSTDNFADGIVCIEHPTFAIAMLEVLTLGFSPFDLVPPIVTG